MKTHTLIILTLCATCCLGGCAKIRQMTRRDFAVLNDPFLDSPAKTTSGEARVAATATAAAAPSSGGTPGFAQVNPSQKTLGGSTTQPTASAENPFRTATRTRTIVPESATSELARIAAGASTSASPSANSVPESKSMDMADMSAFMKQQAEASGLHETAADLEKDFAAFAAARQEEWSKKAQQVNGQAKAQIDQVRQVADQSIAFGQAAMPSIPDMAFSGDAGSAETAQPLIRQMAAQASANVTQAVKEMPNPFEDLAAAAAEPNPFEKLQFDENPFGTQPPASNNHQLRNSAMPQMASGAKPAQQYQDFAAFAESQRTQATEATPASQQKPNPFAEWERPKTAPAGSQTAAPASGSGQAPAASAKQGKLDDSFGFDVGWRPANMERR